ncbi:hypothetical protein QKU48_gp1021 [Fadolivirus algeromassiliense]|jgi:hypothetical protein|uniref:Uncharacterized protein n=1 Tax=Fadolivirus FV1/VV64 TaxID=3070911 RepID=A0A7D3QWE9_9VIRU|nr:hypothetical protein QKU48_gp1021 [Fadolivirus algeromassiliense]QKF94479.1 hypothetical protein Fadolivirus_1_1021 [Fadolivirus FV1/VV64]
MSLFEALSSQLISADFHHILSKCYQAQQSNMKNVLINWEDCNVNLNKRKVIKRYLISSGLIISSETDETIILSGFNNFHKESK